MSVNYKTGKLFYNISKNILYKYRFKFLCVMNIRMHKKQSIT